MPSRAQACAWMAALALAAPVPGAAQDRTEHELIDLIVRDGPQARAIRAGADVVHREQRARLALPNPGVSYSREGAGFTEFLEFEQFLPIFGTRAALSRAGVAATAAAEAERDGRLWMMRSEAATVVAGLTAALARLDAARAMTREIERLIAILEAREREGEGSRFDRLRAEQELHDARVVAAAAAADAASARGALTGMLPPGESHGRIVATIDAAEPAPPLEVLLDRAASGRAELRALRYASERAELEADAARRERLPAPTVFGGWKRADTDAGRENGGVFGVRLTIPLFDTGARAAERWTAEQARADAERLTLQRQIESEIARASETVALWQAALAADEGAAGAELVRIAEVAYREGAAGILELLDAVRSGARARNRSVELRLRARLAQIALERAVGDALWP